MHFVIGSGPAGVSCAAALLARGEEVTMLDAGITLEPAAQAALDAMGGQERTDWDTDVLADWRRMEAGSGVPRKLSYGSGFAYRRAGEFPPLRAERADFSPSFALGGLSNVWGAAVLPYRQDDMDAWPIRRDALAPYYSRVLELMPFAAQIDGLSAAFPLYTDRFLAHDASSQAERLLSALERHRDGLARDGITFGRARLAVRSRSDSGHDCVYCGMCMFGCPYGLIYNSAQTLAELRRDPNFHYIGGQVVERVEESAEGVAVHARPLEGGGVTTYEATRVFLGCGPIPTTKILMESLGIDERIIRDSQYFLAPLLQLRGSGAMTEDLHTLAQLFIEVNDPGVSECTVHLQIYTYNEFYEGELRRRFGRFYPLIPSGAILSRMLVLQGFLHSDDSVRVRIRRKDGALHLKAGGDRRARRVIGRVMRKLMRNAARLGVAPLLPLLNIEAPGKSFHSGGTFPMRARPGPGECDTLGRPYGLKRVHAIDSTTFPSIPATTITLSIMANAYRIGCEYDRTDA